MEWLENSKKQPGTEKNRIPVVKRQQEKRHPKRIINRV